MKIQKHIQFGCVMVAVTIALQMAGFSPAAEAKHFVSRKITATASPAQVPSANFMRFKKADTLWSVLDDAEVKRSMKSIMGTAVEKYFDATQLTEMPSLNGDDLYAAGGVRGLYTISESFFDLNLKTKQLVVAVLNERSLDIYGAQTFDTLPEATRQYIEDLQSRVSGLSFNNIVASNGVKSADELPPEQRAQLVELQKKYPNEKLSIQFKQPDTTAETVAQVSEPKRNLKLGVITGSYSRIDTDPRFESANFEVVRLPGNKIKFCCMAFNGSHTGEASAIIPIENNKAEYKCNFEDKNVGYKLDIQFDGKFVYVNQEGDGFGGIGVYASGTYKKMDDQMPQILAEQ